MKDTFRENINTWDFHEDTPKYAKCKEKDQRFAGLELEGRKVRRYTCLQACVARGYSTFYLKDATLEVVGSVFTAFLGTTDWVGTCICGSDNCKTDYDSEGLRVPLAALTGVFTLGTAQIPLPFFGTLKTMNGVTLNKFWMGHIWIWIIRS